MRANSGIVFGLAVCVALALSGCNGLTLKPASISSNASLTVGTLVNDVERPEFDRFALQAYCGHLAEQLPSGKYRSLYIPAYEGTAAPTLIVPGAKEEERYHSLLDKGGAAQLALYGQNADLTGEDKVEVIVNQLAYCQLNAVSRDAIAKALPQLDAMRVDRNKVYWVAGAFNTQMVTTVMHSITSNAKDAVPPVFNFNGNLYSKDTTTKYQDFIGLQVIPINAVVTNPVGATATVPAVMPPTHPAVKHPPTPPVVLKKSVGPYQWGSSMGEKFNTSMEQAAGQRAVRIVY